jgi:hypothetical protein
VSALDWPEDYDEAMAHARRLRLMTESGDATDRCQCPTCGEVSLTEGNFHRHLTPGRLAEDFVGNWCRDPAGVGLVKDGGGIWHLPGPEVPIARSARLVGSGQVEGAGRHD